MAKPLYFSITPASDTLDTIAGLGKPSAGSTIAVSPKAKSTVGSFRDKFEKSVTASAKETFGQLIKGGFSATSKEEVAKTFPGSLLDVVYSGEEGIDRRIGTMQPRLTGTGVQTSTPAVAARKPGLPTAVAKTMNDYIQAGGQKEILERLFLPMDIISRTVGGIITGRNNGPFNSPTLFEAVEEKTGNTAFGKKFPFMPFVLGLGAEILLPGPEVFKGHGGAETAIRVSVDEFITKTSKAAGELSEKIVRNGTEDAITVAKRIATSEAINYEKLIKSGDIDPYEIFTNLKKLTFTPQAATGRISDIAQKLNFYHKGLGELYTNFIGKPGGQTLKQLETIGREFLVDAVEIFEKGVIKTAGELTTTVRKAVQEVGEEAITKARRGVMTDTIVAELAKGKTGALEDLLSVPPGTVWPVETMHALRQEFTTRFLAATTDTDITNLGKYIPGFLGVRAEPARVVREMGRPLENAPEIYARLQKQIAETTNPKVKEVLEQMAELVTGDNLPTGWDKVLEVWTAVKLTWPVGRTKDIVGNTMGSILRVPEKWVAGAIVDPIRAAIMGGPRKAFGSEALAQLLGLGHGIPTGARKGLDALKSESGGLGRVGQEGLHQIRGAIGGTTGQVVRSPFRLIKAIDEIFYGMNDAAEIGAHATRKALTEGLSGQALARRIDDLIRNPTDDILKIASRKASETIYQEPLEKTMAKINDLRKNPAIRSVAVFFPTPVNLFKQFVQRTPFTMALPSTWTKILKEGGAEADDIIAKALVGSTVLSTLTYWAYNGGITGRFTGTQAEKDARYQRGELPYSINIGGRNFSYRGFEPLAAYFSLAGDIAETLKAPSQEEAWNAVVAIASDFTRQPFLKGISDALDALSDPDRNGSKFIYEFIGGGIPTLLSGAAKLMDKTYRRPTSLLQTLESRLPLLSNKVPPVLNVFGEEAKREGNVAERAFFGTVTQDKQDAVNAELERLSVTIGFPAKVAFKQPLTDDEFELFQRTSGQIIYATLSRLVQSDEYALMNEFQKEQAINTQVDYIREGVRKQLFAEKALINEVTAYYKKQGLRDEQIEALLPAYMNQVKLVPRP